MKFNSRRVREIALVVLVALAATLANLPEEALERFDIDRGLLLGSLALTVFIALFLSLKFQFFFLVVLLAVAANMRGEVAESLGMSTLPLVIAMATMVGFSLINYVVDLLPTGLEKTEGTKRRGHQGAVLRHREGQPHLRAEGPLPEFRPQPRRRERLYAAHVRRGAGRLEDGGAPAQERRGRQRGEPGRRHGDRARPADRLAGVRRHPEEGARRPGGARAGRADPAGEAGLMPSGNKMCRAWSGGNFDGHALPKTRYRNHCRRPLCPKRNSPWCWPCV